jgi:hypothetical protein
MTLLFVMIAVWAYVVFGFVVLVICSCSPYFDDRSGHGAVAATSLILLWPAVPVRTIVRWRRFERARRVVARIDDSAHCVARAYELLGRLDGDLLLEQLAMERSAEAEARDGQG